LLRAVLDANVVVSALIRPEGPAGRILDHVARGAGARAVVSAAILEEYRRALAYPKVRRVIGLPAAETGAWVDALAVVSDIAPGELTVAVVSEDPDDDKYLAAALEGRAAFVVSGDRHLLAVGTYQGVRIVTPRHFLDLVQAPYESAEGT
jgi:putative PIN family toxin of toxin-antitoxin system